MTKQQLIDRITLTIESYWRLDAEAQLSKSASLYWAAGTEAIRVKESIKIYRALDNGTGN